MSVVTPLNFNYSQLPASIPARKKTRRFQPENSSTFSPSTTSVIRIPIRDSAYLDGKSSYLKCTLKNNTATTMELDNNAQSVVARTRILVGGVVAEDIEHTGRLVNMLTQAKGSEDYNKTLQIVAGQASLDADDSANDNLKGIVIPANAEYTFCIPVFSGLLNCGKYLPLGLFGSNALTLELYLETANSVAKWGLAPVGGYSLSSVEYIASLIDIQSDAVNDALKSQMMSSGLEFHGTTYSTHINSHVSGGSLNINIPERCKSLKALITVLYPAASSWAHKTQQSHYPHTTAGQDFSWNYRIGSELLPQQPVGSSSESFVEWQKSINHLWDLDQSTYCNATRWNRAYDLAAESGCFSMTISTEAFANTNAESGLDTASAAVPIALQANGVACDGATVVTYAYKDIIWRIDGTGQFQVSL